MIRLSSSAYPATSAGDRMSGLLTISTKGAPALLKSTNDTAYIPFPPPPSPATGTCRCSSFPVSSSTWALSIRTSLVVYRFRRLSGR